MPAPNDLTPEEEAEFAKFGVASSGPGSPPDPEETPTPTPEPEPEPEPTPTPEPEPEPASITVYKDKAGKFISKDKAIELGLATADDGEPAPAPAPEQAAPEQPKMVPHEALHQSREREKQLAQVNQRLMARLNMVAERLGQPQPEATPDLMTQPVEYLQNLEARLKAFEDGAKQTNEVTQVDEGLAADEAAFAAYTPDYEQASTHYVQSRARELSLLHTPEQCEAILMNEARSIAKMAWQRGQSAAQVVYSLAQARGYAPGAAPAPTPTPRVTPTAIVAAVENGQRQSRSLSGGGASPTNAQVLNAEALLAMDDADFEAAMGLGEKGAEARFARIAGR